MGNSYTRIVNLDSNYYLSVVYTECSTLRKVKVEKELCGIPENAKINIEIYQVSGDIQVGNLIYDQNKAADIVINGTLITITSPIDFTGPTGPTGYGSN